MINDCTISKDNENKYPLEFRINAKNLLLIYENCPKEWSKEFVRDKMIDEILLYKYGEDKFKSRVKAYLISKKEMEDKSQFYCLFILDKLAEFRKRSQLEIDDVNTYRYETVKDILQSVKYVKSQGDWIGKGVPGAI